MTGRGVSLGLSPSPPAQDGLSSFVGQSSEGRGGGRSSVCILGFREPHQPPRVPTGLWGTKMRLLLEAFQEPGFILSNCHADRGSAGSVLRANPAEKGWPVVLATRGWSGSSGK